MEVSLAQCEGGAGGVQMRTVAVGEQYMLATRTLIQPTEERKSARKCTTSGSNQTRRARMVGRIGSSCGARVRKVEEVCQYMRKGKE